MSLRQGVRIPVDRLQQLQPPDEAFKNPVQLAFMRSLVEVLRRITGEMISTQEASPHLLLQAPDGTVYRVTVDNAGLLQVTNARA